LGIDRVQEFMKDFLRDKIFFAKKDNYSIYQTIEGVFFGIYESKYTIRLNKFNCYTVEISKFATSVNVDYLKDCSKKIYMFNENLKSRQLNEN